MPRRNREGSTVAAHCHPEVGQGSRFFIGIPSPEKALKVVTSFRNLLKNAPGFCGGFNHIISRSGLRRAQGITREPDKGLPLPKPERCS
jgi:hypothetical protein